LLSLNPARYKIYTHKGKLLIKKGNYLDAITEFNKTIARNPNYADAWWSKAVTLEYLGNHSEALVNQDKAGQIDPKYLSYSLPTAPTPSSTPGQLKFPFF
jgi:tetratricopeptide (TPR) repeat protein